MKTALISVYDKSNLDILLKKLGDYQIIATGSSYASIIELGYTAIKVEDVTGCKEILSGRVKTLHPNIFGGILSRRDASDNQTLEENNIIAIDLVVCNLYPFEQVVKNPEATQMQIIENIDIGGVSLIRAAAKNYMHTSVLVNPSDYADFDPCNNKLYAQIGFKTTCQYDTLISNYFSKVLEKDAVVNIDLELAKPLSYGENRHQTADFIENESFIQLQGKQLSYNNVLDIEATINLISEFDETVCGAIKHNTPCGVGFGADSFESYINCYNTDPLSIFGGIVGFNCKVDAKTASKLVEIFLEVVIAPEFDPEALEILSQKKNLRVISLKNRVVEEKEIKVLNIGTVIQERDCNQIDQEKLDIVSGEISDETLAQLVRLQKICKHVKSNAIVLGKGQSVVALSGGQTSRVDALKYALDKVEDKSDLLLASDAFFPFVDALELAKAGCVTHIIQPGGSIKDDVIIEYARENSIAMVLTGVRHFKH